MKIPTINIKFLNQLLINSITLKHFVNKIDDKNTICNLIMKIDKNIFKEINDIRSFDININQNNSDKYNWIGLKKYSFTNNINESKNDLNNNNIVFLEFNCLFKEKGEFDLNQIGMVIYSNIPRQQEKYIHKILSPIIVKIE